MDTLQIDTEQPRRGGMLWGTIFTLVPYLLIAVTIALWASRALPTEESAACGEFRPFGLDCTLSPRDGAFFVLAVSVPFATLATGIAWLVVLALGMTRAREWSPVLRGGIGAGLCWLATAITLLIWS